VTHPQFENPCCRPICLVAANDNTQQWMGGGELNVSRCYCKQAFLAEVTTADDRHYCRQIHQLAEIVLSATCVWQSFNIHIRLLIQRQAWQWPMSWSLYASCE
jgi:hypothetical protein